MSAQNTSSISVGARAHRPDVPDAPARGDVIIRREGASPGALYSLREHPAEPQILCSSREHALKTASGFARARGVTVWDDNGTTLTRVPASGPRALRLD